MNVEEQDRYLVARATELIQSDSSISIDGLRVEAQTGVIRLVGDAATESDRERAGMHAKSVKGSVSIANDLRVTGSNVDRERPAGSSNAAKAPAGWVEGYRDTGSAPRRGGEKPEDA